MFQRWYEARFERRNRPCRTERCREDGWLKLSRIRYTLSPQNQAFEHKAAHTVVNGRIKGRFARGLLETLAAHRRPREERSTSAFCSIWHRIGNSMGGKWN
jgi:hypothetical protein